MPHRLVALIVVVLVAWGVGGPVSWGQSVQIDVSDVPLEQALGTVRAETGLDLVYAERLVRGRSASCRYAGKDRRAALQCVLDGTGLRAERVRRRQYVLVGTSSSDAPEQRAALTGYVVDAETGGRLPGANVYLTDLQAGATTNADGYFVVSSLPASTLRPMGLLYLSRNSTVNG